MTGGKQRPNNLSHYRDHYLSTRDEHRRIPVLVPFAAIATIAILAFFFLDPVAGALQGGWPDQLALGAAVITDIGRSWWVLTVATLVILVAALAKRLHRYRSATNFLATLSAMAFYVLSSVGLASLLVNIVKRVIGRARPVEFHDLGVFSFRPLSFDFNFESFPSGHSTVNGALFMALGMLFPTYRWLFLPLGFVFALTRIFVGAHYPSDVATGFGFGMWFAFVTALIFSRFGILFETREMKILRK